VPAAASSPIEDRRLAAVRRLGLLGTPAEERFDRITRLARRVFDVPMSAIDIVTEKLAWLKSIQGFDGIDAPRCDSYCHHTVLEDEVLIVRDARVDPRVHDSAFANNWVFYAGVPLHFDGQRVGVLCIGDSKPRDLDAESIALLRDLGAMVEEKFEIARLSEVQLKLARSNEELEMKANIDVLTRIWNRRAILEIAEAERDRLAGAIAVLLLDIDHFKSINDVYGHAAGDEVLRASAERLRASIRPRDAAGRLGGEEFMVLITDIQAGELPQMAERIRSIQAKAPVRFDDHAIGWTCSIGYAMGTPEEPIGTLLRRADRALYRAKAAGRNCVEAAG
jgi:diguanylate cyclase (GGDEF)-like protein